MPKRFIKTDKTKYFVKPIILILIDFIVAAFFVLCMISMIVVLFFPNYSFISFFDEQMYKISDYKFPAMLAYLMLFGIILLIFVIGIIIKIVTIFKILNKKSFPCDNGSSKKDNPIIHKILKSIMNLLFLSSIVGVVIFVYMLANLQNRIIYERDKGYVLNVSSSDDDTKLTVHDVIVFPNSSEVDLPLMYDGKELYYKENSLHQLYNINSKLMISFENPSTPVDFDSDILRASSISYWGSVDIESIYLPDNVINVSSKNGILNGRANIRTLNLPFLGKNKNDVETNTINYLYGDDTESLKSIEELIIRGGKISNNSLSNLSFINRIVIDGENTTIENKSFDNCESKSIYLKNFDENSMGELTFSPKSIIEIDANLFKKLFELNKIKESSNISIINNDNNYSIVVIIENELFESGDRKIIITKDFTGGSNIDTSSFDDELNKYLRKYNFVISSYSKVGSSNSLNKINVNENMILKADIVFNDYDIVIENDNRFGSIEVSGERKYGKNVSFVAIPNDGYVFNGCIIDGDEYSELTNSLLVKNNIKYKAEWIEIPIVLQSDMVKGTTQLTSDGYVGGNATLHAIVNDGYEFVGWLYDDIIVSTEKDYVITMPNSNSLHTYYAKMLPNSGTKYKVEHYLENFDGTYDATLTEDFYGETNTYTEANSILYDGFTAQPFNQERISGSGDTIIKIYYKRNEYVVSMSQNNMLGGDIIDNGGTYFFDKDILLNATNNAGYTFDGWFCNDVLLSSELEFLFKTPADNINIEARWTPNSNTKYTVYHFQQNITDDNYTLYDTVYKYGTTDTLTNEMFNKYEGFLGKGFSQTNISGDGSAEIYIYYTRMKYVLRLDAEGIDDNCKLIGSGTFKYGATVIIDTEYSKQDYTFEGWSMYYNGSITTLTSLNSESVSLVNPISSKKSFKMPAKDVTYVAKFVKNYSLRIASDDVDGKGIKKSSISVYVNGSKISSDDYNTYPRGDRDYNNFEYTYYVPYGRKVTVNYEFEAGNQEIIINNSVHLKSKNDSNLNSINSGFNFKFEDFYSKISLTMVEGIGIWFSSWNCLAEGTEIIMSDYSTKNVEDIKTGDEVLVFNHFTGELDSAVILFNDSEILTDYEIIDLVFDDETSLEIISEHGFYDIDLNKYVYITALNYNEFINHRFLGVDGIVTLVEVKVYNKITKVYSPISSIHYNYYTNGILSIPGGMTGFINIFEFDSNYKYDEEKMNNDIEMYGLLDYSFFEELIPYDVYVAFNGQYLGVAFAKGLMTEELLNYYVTRYGGYWT